MTQQSKDGEEKETKIKSVSLSNYLKKTFFNVKLLITNMRFRHYVKTSHKHPSKTLPLQSPVILLSFFQRTSTHYFSQAVNSIYLSRKWQPIQYSYLENPTDGEVWWAIVHGVTKESHTTVCVLHVFLSRFAWHEELPKTVGISV